MKVFAASVVSIWLSIMENVNDVYLVQKSRSMQMKTTSKNKNRTFNQGVIVEDNKYKLVELAKHLSTVCILGGCSLVVIYAFLTTLAESGWR